MLPLMISVNDFVFNDTGKLVGMAFQEAIVESSEFTYTNNALNKITIAAMALNQDQ